MNRIAKKDTNVAQMIADCDRLGVKHENRDGVPHHPEAENIFELLKESDLAFGNDHFGWKSGGDGDNGEGLMYSLSILLELRDAKVAEEVSKEAGGFKTFWWVVKDECIICGPTYARKAFAFYNSQKNIKNKGQVVSACNEQDALLKYQILEEIKKKKEKDPDSLIHNIEE